MNILRSVHVEGFWGTKQFTIDFHPDVNFLIGVNGSGKTTVINMIAAGLTADLQTLDRLPFKKLRIDLVGVRGKRRPSIEIEKKPKKGLPFPQVSFRIHSMSSNITLALASTKRERLFADKPIQSLSTSER